MKATVDAVNGVRSAISYRSSCQVSRATFREGEESSERATTIVLTQMRKGRKEIRTKKCVIRTGEIILQVSRLDACNLEESRHLHIEIVEGEEL
ncbi:unnamed protein product [Calypogeia fissa]